MTYCRTNGAADTAQLVASPPDGWQLLEPQDEGTRLVMVGPRDAHGVRPRLEIWAEPGTGEPIEVVSLGVAAALRRERPTVPRGVVGFGVTARRPE